MTVGNTGRAASLVCIAALFSTACTTLDPYTREERTSRAQNGAVIGAISGAVVGLVNRQIENRLFNFFSIGIQSPADKAAACQYDSTGVYGMLDSCPANIDFKRIVGPGPNFQYSLQRMVLNRFTAQSPFKSFSQAQTGYRGRDGGNFKKWDPHQILQIGHDLFGAVKA